MLRQVEVAPPMRPMVKPAPTIEELVRECLVNARALLEKGWTQGVYHITAADGRVRYCAIGAITTTAATYEIRCSARRCLDISAILTWNDAPNRTQAEVLAAFDRAIESI